MHIFMQNTPKPVLLGEARFKNNKKS